MSAETGLSNGFVSGTLVTEMTAFQKATIEELPTPPRLAVILSGHPDDFPAYAANESYALRLKAHGENIGTTTDIHRIAYPTEDNTLRLITSLNEASEVDGIIPMLPAPSQHIDRLARSTIKPDKDIDGVAPNSPFCPATPAAMVYTAEAMLGRTIDSAPDLGSVAIIGNGAVVGAPLAELLKGRGVQNLTVLGTRSEIEAGIPNLRNEARLIFSAVPAAGIIRPEHLASGSTIVDVGYGINQDTGRPGGNVDERVFLSKLFRATAFRHSVGPVTAAIIHQRVIEQASLKYARVHV